MRHPRSQNNDKHNPTIRRLDRWKFMKFWCVRDPRAIQCIRGLAGAGLVMLAVMPGSNVLAEQPAKPPAAEQEKAAAEKAAQEKAATEKAAQEKAAAEKAAAEKAAQEKAAAEKAAQEKAAAEKAAAEKAAAEKAMKDKAAAKAGATAKAAALVPAECVRTGQRVIAALARDDTGAANQFFAFYNTFKCSQPHLAQAFGCLVKFQAANPAIANPSSDVVKSCWDDPLTLPKAPPPPAALPPESP